MSRKFANSQRAALAWLSDNWQTAPGRIGPAIDSLRLMYCGLVEVEYGKFGPRGGWRRRLRLTQAGIQARRDLLGDTP